MSALAVFRTYYRIRRAHLPPYRAAWVAFKEAIKPTPF